jgi:hypothetical protein
MSCLENAEAHTYGSEFIVLWRDAPEGDVTPPKGNADWQTATDSSAFRSHPEAFSYELS